MHAPASTGFLYILSKDRFLLLVLAFQDYYNIGYLEVNLIWTHNLRIILCQFIVLDVCFRS
jgi:hypothetical protein